MRCQGIFTFDNTRARVGHRAFSRAFSRWGAFSATVATSPREFFPIECVCRLKNIFLSRDSPVGSYSLGTWTLLLSVFPGWFAPLLHLGGAGIPYSRNTPRKGLSSRVVRNRRRRSMPKERDVPCPRPLVSSHTTVAQKETASRTSAV